MQKILTNSSAHSCVGDKILFSIESTPSFQYPLDPACPILFICTGTGFAPIRGLLQKWSYFQSRDVKLGPSFLIFGSRSSSEGLFHDEIKEFQEQGVLTKAFMCYSREKKQRKSTLMVNYVPLKLEKYWVPFWQIQLPTSSCVDLPTWPRNARFPCVPYLPKTYLIQS